MFSFALKQNIPQCDPLENVKQIKQPKSAPAYFTYNDLNKITALVTSEPFKASYVTAFFTGMRLNELINLNWSNISPTIKYRYQILMTSRRNPEENGITVINRSPQVANLPILECIPFEHSFDIGDRSSENLMKK